MSQSIRRIDLLPRELLVKTGPVDEGDWHYRPLLRRIMNQRIQLMVRLLRGNRFRRLLDLGYGSGILLPELAKYCDELHGLDVHSHHVAIAERLRGVGVDAILVSGTAEAMPYESHFFDAVVAMSSLEFIEHIDDAMGEVARVLRPAGALILVSPEETLLGDRVLRWITGVDGQKVFDDRRRRVRQALPRFFHVQTELTYSPVPHIVPPVYRAFRLTPSPPAARESVARAV